MAHIQNRKTDYYSQKQSVREELSAPQYLESAGDVLIKRLARKQTNTRTSLQEQLEIVQNFEKGFELNPDNQRGVTCLEEFKKRAVPESSDADTPPEKKQIKSLDELMKDTGLTRHELELGLCEKPNSAVSQLYMFALENKRESSRKEGLTSRWPEHPINHLKEIEEECFGEKKKDGEGSEPPGGSSRKAQGRKKHRKRKRKGADGPVNPPPQPCPRESPTPGEEEERPKTPITRPSLWDVKDMKKWSESKKIGCRPPGLYAIKHGEIIKLGEGSPGGDVT